MISNSIGIGHLIASILALIAGSSVLKNPKGTKTHKQIGYIYTVAMSIVLISSFMIYRLHGTFGIMYWSVIGLYCAFFAEVLTRIPFILEVEDNIAVIFYAMVGVATAIVASIGSFYFRRFKKKWNVFTVDIEENS